MDTATASDIIQALDYQHQTDTSSGGYFLPMIHVNGMWVNVLEVAASPNEKAILVTTAAGTTAHTVSACPVMIRRAQAGFEKAPVFKYNPANVHKP